MECLRTGNIDVKHECAVPILGAYLKDSISVAIGTILHPSYGTHIGAHQPITDEENVCVQNSIFIYKELI